jgi:rare lipoprotein A (peptidoglycan hydrolase)
MTCALWITGKHGRPLRPDGRLVRVRNVETGKEVVVRWTDNGPGRKARGRGVICDLTPAAFLALGEKLKNGKIRVEIEGVK